MQAEFERQEDGTFNITVKGVKLSDTEELSVLNGIYPEVELNIVDGRRISFKQRKLVFALLNDIYAHTGQPHEYMRQMFQFYLKIIKGYERFSLSNCTMTQANELIEIILNWVFLHDIPLNYKTSDLMREDKNFLYLATINRKCIICGKPKSHLAHREAVGAGRNRNKINHYGHHVLALCFEHHAEQHNMGVDSFDEKYHLKNSWIKVDDRLNSMLQGKKMID